MAKWIYLQATVDLNQVEVTTNKKDVTGINAEPSIISFHGPWVVEAEDESGAYTAGHRLTPMLKAKPGEVINDWVFRLDNL